MSDTVLITGSSSGYGEATAKLFAARGWNVVATMRNPADGKALAALKNVIVNRLDVQDRKSIDLAITEGIDRFGRIDAVVNNAGYGLLSVFEAAPREAIQKNFDVNVLGAMDVMRAILPHFRANRSGTIIVMSTAAGAVGVAGESLYCASKFALEGFSEAVSYELEGLGIKIKIIEPGSAPGTGFTARAQRERAGFVIPDDYKAFTRHAAQLYAEILRSADSGAIDKVVESIFAAATDGTDQLRYVPNEDARQVLAARRDSSEEAYMALMRNFNRPQLETAK
ncbi:SDR family oxidoreductase [Bradyrhizobium sp. SYSU BS000235]|uniref:SDR family oxidoreductase n=1 Tax=Bradyrhizobium sp. SYSU BS000235 TaxID=3411332 RepID=UPI003C740888